MDVRKYINEVAFRTYFKNTTLNTLATSNTPALWNTTIYPIDVNEKGASPMILEVGFWGISNAGYFYLVKAINVDGNPYRITAEDTFFSGYAPTGGLRGIVYKSAYKGYAFAIAPVWLSQLDNIARDYVNSLEKSILWQNDPNARRIPFTNISQPSIPDYRANIVDADGITFNPSEDYGNDATFEIWQQTDTNKYSKLQIEPEKTYSAIDGNLDSILWSDSGDNYSGYILIRK